MAYRLDLPDGSFVTVEDDAKPRSVALAEAKSKFPDAFPAPPGIGQQILGLPAEIGKGFVRGLTVDPISGAASTVYTGARAAGADLTPFEKTAVGKGLASAQTALAPSDEGLVTQFGSGLGSLLSYIPGGILKGGIGLAAKLGQAGGVGAEEARSRAEQARLEGQADATAGQEFAAQLGGTAVGFSELAPVRLLTKPIEQILRGVPKSQADLIAPGLFNSAKRMVATGGVEGLQEGMANIAQDLIAKGIYNPNLEVGESALGDAAMGASIGAFAQGAIELATRGKRGQLYEQLKTQERLKEEAEQQRIAQQQQAVIAAQEQEKMGQAMGALGATPQIDPATGKPVLLLGAPAKEVNLQDPLGIRFDANDLSPKVVNDINKARKERGLPAIDQFTVEDLYDLAPNKNAISELLGRKMGYDESVSVTPRNIFDIAASKNIDVQDPGFAEFLTRTTGTPDIRRMTAQQLFAAQQSISALPDFTELTKLPTGSIATVFDEKTYNKTINDLKKTVLNTGPLGKEATVQEIMDFSGLTKPQDAERLLQTAIQRGDLSASPTRGTVGTSINISVPFVPKSVVPGPDIRRGDFMESENVGYDIVSEDGTFKQFRPTLGAAEDLVAKANQNRETKVARIAGEIDRVSSGIELDKQRLGQLQEVGEEGSAEYKRLQAKIQKQEVNLGNLNSKIQSVSQPLQIKAKEKPRSRTGYTLFDNGKPIGTYPTKEDADIAAIQSLSDEQLDGVINAAPRSDVEGALEEPFGKQQLPTGTIRGATPRRLYIEATKEKERRFRQQAGLPPLAAPVEIKITGDAQAAAEKLRAVGLTVRFMPEVEKEVPEINKRLRAVLDKLGLQEVRLNIIESLSVKGFIIDGPDGKPMAFYPQPQAGTPKFKEVMAVLNDAKAKGLNVREGVSSANGSYVAQLIEIALDSANPIRATRHEALHALRDLGFFTKEQWSVLENKAKSEWMKKYNIAQRYGGLDYDSQIEEAVADAFSDFDQTQPPAGLVGVLFRKIKTFFEALGNAFRGSGFQTAADVFTRVEEGGLTGPGATTAGETKLSLQEPISPLAQYVAPEDAEGRLRRRLGRAEGVGAPSNDRLVFGKGKEKLIIGKITPQDWKERVQNTMSAPEIEDARNWYQQLNDFFTPVFGDRASEFSLAWLLSQQRASPTKGFTDVLRASDIAENKLRIKKAGLNEKSLVAALKGEVPEGGIGAKLMDFVDSELGKSLRTVMGDKKEGRQPAAIDVWAQRDIGFIDDTVKEFVAKKFGKDAADTLDVDTARFGEPQYEYGVDFYNDVAQYLNRQKYMGGGWTAREVQAVGWVNMQIFMGVKPEFVRDIVNGNTRRVSIGLAPGTGSVMTGRLMGKEIPVKDAQNIINDLAKISNIKVTQSLDGIGAYLTYVEGSIQVDAVGSPESVDSFMDMIGYVFQQTEVINTRPLASGKNSAIDILSPSLNSQSKAVEFFTEYLKAMPKDKNGDPIAPGFQQIKVDGVPGIRLVNFGGKWNKKQLEALAKASEVAEAATGIKEAQFVDMNVQFTSTANDWVKYPDGDQYVDSLRNRGRLQEAQLLRDQFPPTRFDLAGDGTINWRPRLSFRPDEPIDRSGIGSGISIREQQPSAQSYDAVHYGKQRVNNLAGSMYGTGIKGAEAQRLAESTDPRIRERAYFYIPYSNGRMPMPEAGLGNEVHIQRLNNLLGPSPEAQALSRAARTPDGQFDANAFESSVIDAGYDGYAIPDMGMAVVLGADVPVQPRGTRQEIEERPEEGKIQIGDRKYSLRQTDTDEFKQWFGKSQIKTLRGEPKRMYHGTARDISEFRPKQANAIFLTYEPSFAEDFTGMSENYMADEFFYGLSEPEKNVYRKRAEKLAKRNETNYADELLEIIKEQLPSRANIMPLYVRAENPFDYENPDHISAVDKAYDDSIDSFPMQSIMNGSWSSIEDRDVQNAIKSAGFDSFYVREGGRKNLAVYDPNQIKSAIGNVGTFARDNNDIRYSIALGAIEPSTSLIPDVGGNPNGILGFMPDRLGGKPIRMLVGTHNDLVPELDNERMRRPQSYGANHILNRVLSDPSRIPGGAEELLEKIVKTAQTTAQKYNRIFKEGNMFIIYDGRNSLIVSPQDDAMSIVTMYVQNQPERRYGNAVFSGRAPSMPQEFVEPIRGMDVVAGEGRVQIKPSEVKVIKPSKVLEISPVTEMAPTKAGTLGVKKLSLVEPIDTDTAQRIPQDTFNVDPNTSKDNLIYLLQNKQIDLKRVIDGIRSAGKDIADKWNAYLKEELFHGRSATRIRFFMDRELQPLLKKMESSDISLDQMDEYLLARHAPEANSYIRSINPDPNANAGMSDQEAANYMNSLPAPRRAALERIAKDVDAITKGTRQLMVDYGLEDQKTIDTWERTYKKYVPLFREETEGNPISTGRGYQIRGSTTKRRMGSTRSVVDVLANIAMQREKTIVRGEKNRVGNSLYGLVLTNPNKGFWGVIDPGKVNRQTLRNELIGLGIDSAEADQMVNEMSSRPYQKTIDKATGLVVQRIPPSWAKAENIFVTRINGQDRFIGFNKNDERAMRMATTLKNLDAQQQAEAIKMMGTAGDYYKGTINAVGKATRFFASVNTQYNPAFGIYNLMRDIGGAVLNLQSTPLKGSERKIISDALGLIKDIYSDLRRQRQGLPADSKSAQIFEEFELEGGKTGYRDLFEDSQSRAEQLQKDLEDFKSGKPLKGKGKAVMRWLSDFNDSIENAIRVSVYKNALDKGISKEKAASLAKNITVNFNRTGAMSRNFQTLYAFFNASVQGTTRIVETLFTPDGKLSPTGKKIVMGGITLGLMQAVLLAMAGLDDDEVPDFVKDKSFIIPYGDGKYLAVPMPLGYNIIPGFGRRVMEFAMSDDKNVGKSVFETANMIIDGFNPLGSATFVQTLAPTIADPIVALAENKDFTGKPIAREDINSLVPTPGYTRKSQNASAITEALAYGINILSGGTEFKQGVISPTPDQIEYLVGQVFGGVGREAMKVGRGLEALATGEELATYNIPIAGRLVGNIQQKAAQTGRFYDNIKALNEHQAEIEGRMARGEDITEYVNDNPEAMLYQLGDKTYSKISKLRQLKKTLEESGASRDQTKAIDDAMLNLMVSLNMSYNSARQQ
jgi:hypothetical protein